MDTRFEYFNPSLVQITKAILSDPYMRLCLELSPERNFQFNIKNFKLQKSKLQNSWSVLRYNNTKYISDWRNIENKPISYKFLRPQQRMSSRVIKIKKCIVSKWIIIENSNYIKFIPNTQLWFEQYVCNPLWYSDGIIFNPIYLFLPYRSSTLCNDWL